MQLLSLARSALFRFPLKKNGKGISLNGEVIEIPLLRVDKPTWYSSHRAYHDLLDEVGPKGEAVDSDRVSLHCRSEDPDELLSSDDRELPWMGIFQLDLSRAIVLKLDRQRLQVSHK